jgi:hypothetical protein
MGTLGSVDGTSQEAAMDPVNRRGVRKHYTDLDIAALTDIGWEWAADGDLLTSEASDSLEIASAFQLACLRPRRMRDSPLVR